MVSGALDRLHYEKDPCVKYDIGRKLWIYLHRDRSEEEFGVCPASPGRPGTLSQPHPSPPRHSGRTPPCGGDGALAFSETTLLPELSCPLLPTERIHQAQAAAAKARKALQQKPKPPSKVVSDLAGRRWRGRAVPAALLTPHVFPPLCMQKSSSKEGPVKVLSSGPSEQSQLSLSDSSMPPTPVTPVTPTTPALPATPISPPPVPPVNKSGPATVSEPAKSASG